MLSRLVSRRGFGLFSAGVVAASTFLDNNAKNRASTKKELAKSRVASYENKDSAEGISFEVSHLKPLLDRTFQQRIDAILSDTWATTQYLEFNNCIPSVVSTLYYPAKHLDMFTSSMVRQYLASPKLWSTLPTEVQETLNGHSRDEIIELIRDGIRAHEATHANNLDPFKSYMAHAVLNGAATASMVKASNIVSKTALIPPSLKIPAIMFLMVYSLDTAQHWEDRFHHQHSQKVMEPMADAGGVELMEPKQIAASSLYFTMLTHFSKFKGDEDKTHPAFADRAVFFHNALKQRLQTPKKVEVNESERANGQNPWHWV